MPAPPAAFLQSTIIGKMNPKNTNHPSFIAFVASLSKEINTQWDSWRSGMSFGQITVAGAGVGTWLGAGAGGSISAGSIQLSPSAVISGAGFPRQMPATVKLIQNLSDILQQKFGGWVSGYKFAGISFSGTSTATPINPGVFVAKNIPIALLAAGTGQLPSGIASAWNGKLGQEENGITFQLSKNGVAIADFTQAVGSAIETAFATLWMASLTAQNSVNGSAAPGGVGSGSSQTDGKII